MGNGRSIHFWDDCWIGKRPLASDPLLGAFKDTYVSSIRLMVSNYWKEGKWMNLVDVNPSLTQLQLSLNSFMLKNRSEDEIIWIFSSNGKFSVAFVDCCVDPYVPWWSKVWIKGFTPKVNIFFWLLVLSKILTTDNLSKRGFPIPNRCYLCLKETKSVDHLFLHILMLLKYVAKFFKNEIFVGSSMGLLRSLFINGDRLIRIIF